MAIHIGKKIQEIAESKGYTQGKLAKEINTTQQNVSDLYSRSTIDTELLTILCKKLNYDFFQYYYEEEPLLSLKTEHINNWQLKIDALNAIIVSKDELLSTTIELVETQRKLIIELETKTSA